MAFSPIDIPVTEILQSDFVTDIALISNANDLLLKDKLEDLINNFEIDTNTLSIGTDNPINYMKVDTLIMQDTGFVFQAGTPTQVIGSLTKNNNDESILTVDFININQSLDVDSVSVNSISATGDANISGNATFSGSVTNQSSVVESKENVLATLTNDSGVAKATITLTDTTRQNIFLTLEADTSVYLGGGLVGALSDIKVYIDFDASNPPTENTEFTIYIVDVFEQGTTTSIIGDINTYPLDSTIVAGTNQSTASPIILHSDFAAALKNLGVQAPDLEAYGSSVSFIYILDADTNDRLMIKSTAQMDIF